MCAMGVPSALSDDTNSIYNCSPLLHSSPLALGDEDLLEITDYILDMENAKIYGLGVALGLRNKTRLKQ